MATYRLEHRPTSSSATIEHAFEARDDAAAVVRAGELIAESHGMTGAYVMIDAAAGAVTIGAGYRSRRGTFQLQRIKDS